MKQTQYDPNCAKQSESWPTHRLNVPQACEPVRKPLISCELDSMNVSVQELQEEVDRLVSRLPCVLTPSGPACPGPKDPQELVELPPIGDAIRDLRIRVEGATSVLRDLRSRLEI